MTGIEQSRRGASTRSDDPTGAIMTDPDIIDQAAEEMHSYECPEDPDPGETCTCDTGHYDRLARILADAGLLRDSDQQHSERMAADAKVYADLDGEKKS